MIDQIKVLIEKSFPPAIGYKLEYFVGEDEDTKRQHLIFDLTSVSFGGIYKKGFKMSPGMTVSDCENDFIGVVLSDFIVLGTTFLTNNIVTYKKAVYKEADDLLKNPFSKGNLNKMTLN